MWHKGGGKGWRNGSGGTRLTQFHCCPTCPTNPLIFQVFLTDFLSSRSEYNYVYLQTFWNHSKKPTDALINVKIFKYVSLHKVSFFFIYQKTTIIIYTHLTRCLKKNKKSTMETIPAMFTRKIKPQLLWTRQTFTGFIHLSKPNWMTSYITCLDSLKSTENVSSTWGARLP